MKKFLVVILMTMSLCFAQETTIYLLKSEKSDMLEICRANKLPVYYLWNDQAVVELTDKQQKLLSSSIKIMPICKSQLSSNFTVLLCDKRASLDYYRISGDIFYSDNKLQIVNKPQNLVRNDLKNLSAKILPLKDQPITQPEVTHYRQNKVENNAEIANVLTYINQDSVRSYIQHLQNFQTRYSQHQNRREIAVWIHNKFKSFGLTNVELDSFYFNGKWQYNVIATLLGSESPNDILILGGHHDSTVWTTEYAMTWAPGADDNASGAASVLESARAIALSGFNNKKTIRFTTFAYEEGAGAGSEHEASEAVANQEKIKLMLNNDMIANCKANVADWMVDIIPHPGLNAYEQVVDQVFDNYTSLDPFIGSHSGFGYLGSDNASFYQKGFPTQCFSESYFSPNWHKNTDIIDSCNIPYATEIIKGTCAVLLYHNLIPSRLDSLSLFDINGTGKSIMVKWSKSNESNITGYKLYLGNISGQYTQTLTLTDTSFTFNNLPTDSLYFIGVSSLNSNGDEGIILEKNIKLILKPEAPIILKTESDWHKVKLSWSKNHELDLAGYNVYQSTNNSDFTKINTTVIIDTLLLVNDPSQTSYTYFKVTAVDNDGNESEFSSSVAVRPVSLNQGILIVDESANGSGTLPSPDDTQQDLFFSSLLTNCPQVSNYDAQSSGKISLSELGPYSTVIWHNQSTELGSVMSQNQNVIKKYLDFGGKILITADKPGKLIESCNSYPTDFSSTSLAEQYFGIDSVNYKSPSRFSGAIPTVSGFNYLTVDSNKAQSANGFHIKKIETLKNKPNAEVIYKYDSKYSTTENYGYSKNQPVGIIYSGSNFKTATLAVPLYFIKQNEAKKVVEYILKEKFGETVDIKDNSLLTDKSLFLDQNYPNPFNNTTAISFTLPKNGIAELRVYNAKGELVKELLNQEFSAGKHSVMFKADNLNSGVYFYRLNFGGQIVENKLVLVK